MSYSHPACVLQVLGTAGNGKERCMLWSCPTRSLDMPEAHIQAQIPGNRCMGQRLLLYFTATLLNTLGHWQLLNASEIGATKHGIHSLLPASKQVITLTSISTRTVRYWQRVMLGKERRSWGHRQEGGEKSFLTYRKKCSLNQLTMLFVWSSPTCIYQKHCRSHSNHYAVD